jgi:hypothetical protein
MKSFLEFLIEDSPDAPTGKIPGSFTDLIKKPSKEGDKRTGVPSAPDPYGPPANFNKPDQEIKPKEGDQIPEPNRGMGLKDDLNFFPSDEVGTDSPRLNDKKWRQS